MPSASRSGGWTRSSAGSRCLVSRRKARMAELKIQQHPDKTFIGRVSRGFGFLGYRLSAAGIVGVAKLTVERCAPADEPAL